MKSIKKIEIRAKRIKLMESRAPYNITINIPETIANIASSILEDVDDETFLAIPLDVRNRVLGYVEVASGGPDLCTVDPRKVFRAAILMNASAIMIVHNHPSGEVIPSSEDITLTKRICEAGDILGIPVLDHIIVSHDNWMSFAEKGLIERREPS